jgi:hypothetical protein
LGGRRRKDLQQFITSALGGGELIPWKWAPLHVLYVVQPSLVGLNTVVTFLFPAGSGFYIKHVKHVLSYYNEN